MRKRILITAAMAAAIAGAAATAAALATSPSPPAWAPSGPDVQLALNVAHDEASGTGASGGAATATADSTGWPANITGVQVLDSTRQYASIWTDGSPAPDNRNVVVIRMTGDFTVTTTGPSDKPPTQPGKTITVVADAASGQVLDFYLSTQPQLPLPAAKVVFSRATVSNPAG